MIDESLFDNTEGVELTKHALPKADVDEAMRNVPSWVPDEYREFFDHFCDFIAPGFVLFSPVYPPAYFYNIDTGYKTFQETLEVLGFDPERWFPVGHFDGFSYAVYHLNDDGTMEFGAYDFTDQDYFEGPFGSFVEWMEAQA
ncbi:hypothetical protein [Corynebacterium cystitidis]|uniref:hypothetical protein n=1 Tax=Corynebacterium cystitidis TaxID=35757 RepID=UPI00211EB9F3|nr:hypothetical protein [Corynebacterium cystitidis]